MRGDVFAGLLVGRVELGDQRLVGGDPVVMRGDAEIGNALAAGEALPRLGHAGIEHADVRLLRLQQRIGRLPELHRVGAVGERIADEARRGGIDHLDLGSVDTLLLGEELRHHEVRGRGGGGELLALQVLDRLDIRPRGDEGAPEVEQVEQIFHLHAARVGKPDGQHRGAAADLELAGIELRRVGVRRPLDEFDVEAVLGVELLRLDHRRHEGAERGEAEHHDGDFGRRLRGGGIERGKRERRRRTERDQQFLHGRTPPHVIFYH